LLSMPMMVLVPFMVAPPQTGSDGAGPIWLCR